MSSGRKTIEKAQSDIFETIENIYEKVQSQEIRDHCINLKGAVEAYSKMGFNKGMMLSQIELVDAGIKESPQAEMLKRLLDAKEFFEKRTYDIKHSEHGVSLNLSNKNQSNSP